MCLVTYIARVSARQVSAAPLRVASSQLIEPLHIAPTDPG